MRTIIKEGKIPPNAQEPRYFLALCTHCTTEFTFAFEDCEGDINGPRESLIIKCPVCKKAYILKSDNIMPISVGFYKDLMKENNSH